MPYSFFADALLLLHFAFVLFVVLGLPMIWIGGWLRWSLVRNPWFRSAHLLAMGVVAAESLAGMTCPLTTWENQLRVKAGGGLVYQGSFVQHWVHQVLFFEAAESTFTLIYLVFLAAVAASFWWVKPRWQRSTKTED